MKAIAPAADARGADTLARALLWLGRLPFLEEEGLAALLGVDRFVAQRALASLGEAGWTDWVVPASPELDARRFYYLTEAGVDALARAMGADREDVESRYAVSRRELLARVARVETAAALNAFFADMAEVVREDEEVTLEDARSLPWTRCPGGRWWPPGVEAYGALRSGCWRAPFFVAWDRAGAPMAHRRMRVAGWYAYLASERNPWGVEGLPPILMVCPSEREATQWGLAVESSADRRRIAPLAVYIGTASEIFGLGALGAVWRRPDGQRRATLVDRLRWVSEVPRQVGVEPSLLHVPVVQCQPRSRRRGLREWARQATAEPGSLKPGERVAALALSTSTTQKELLEWVGHHPFLSAADLAVLSGLREAGTERLLAALVRLGLVDFAVRPVGGDSSPPRRYFLTEEGLRLLAARDGVPQHRYGRHGVLAVGGDASDGEGQRLAGLLRHFEHTVGVNSFVVGLATEAATLRARGQDHRLLHWLSAAEAQEWFRWNGRWWHVWPDARFLYRANGVEFDVFLEWDRATVRRRDYVEKFRAYGSFFASRQAGQLARCRLLVVTTTPAAERRIAEVIQSASGTAPALLVAYLTTGGRLEHAGALGDVWRLADGGGRQTWC
ncbi:MAG: replication-relaxation family protein [Chloroflexota bacterium]|nr:replication-relaxation family protein [Chloroflexota bacterium]